MEQRGYRNILKRTYENDQRNEITPPTCEEESVFQSLVEHKNKRVKQYHIPVPIVINKQNDNSLSNTRTKANNRLKKLRDELDNTISLDSTSQNLPITSVKNNNTIKFGVPNSKLNSVSTNLHHTSQKNNNSIKFGAPISELICESPYAAKSYHRKSSKFIYESTDVAKTSHDKSTIAHSRISNLISVPKKNEIDYKINIKPKCDINSSKLNEKQDKKDTQISFDDDLEMEWLPIDSEELISDIRLVRENLFSVSSPTANAELVTNFNINRESPGKYVLGNIYIIVDTNVFIDNIQIIVKILDINYQDGSYPVIFIPWMVIEELDYFKVNSTSKQSKAIQTSSRKAIRFINECLIAKKPNFQGQSVRDAAEDRSRISSPDDSILSCCLQAAKHSKTVLLSNDINLRNKAIINNIDAYIPSDIINILMQKKTKQKSDLTDKITNLLSFVCSFIIRLELKETMGEAWYINKKFKGLPWKFSDCILYLKQYYNLVFKQVLPKQSLRIVDGLYEILHNTKGPTCDENKFIELCFSLLIYIKAGLPKYVHNIEDTINQIKLLEKECT